VVAPLQQAASRDIATVKSLLASGTDVNGASKQKLTALHAVHVGALPVAIVLLDAGEGRRGGRPRHDTPSRRGAWPASTW
jgi:hypothetical protein